MKIRAFITHKKAEHFADCQDRFSINTDTKSAAVSDGMSQSIFQKIWAEILVDTYTKDTCWHPSEDIENKKVHEELSVIWQERVDNRLRELQEEGKLTYLAEGMLAQGKSAGATLAGVRFNGQSWNGDVLGDTCVVEVEKGNIVHIHTSQDNNAFDNYPDYYDSNPHKEGKGKPKAICGQLQSDSLLLIVSDPFSDLFCELQKQDKGKVPTLIEQVLALKTHNDYEKLISDWRTNYGMHNDDSTLAIIEYDGSDEFSMEVVDDIRNLESAEEPCPLITRNSPFKKGPASPSIQETPAIENETTQLKRENAALKEENKALTQKNKELEKKVDELNRKGGLLNRVGKYVGCSRRKKKK